MKNFREKIDIIDKQLVDLFKQRLSVCKEIGEYKAQNGMPLSDPVREREKLYEVSGLVEEDLQRYTSQLYSTIFDLSKAYQSRSLAASGALSEKIENAVSKTSKEFPERAMIACQGVEGAFSQIACERLFNLPGIMYFENFNAVFTAIEKGLCKYGVLPIENSTAGSVNQVYDLMMQHKFSIVRSIRIKVEHCLVAKKGTKLSDVKEIISHEQAINQSGEFIKSLGNVKVSVYENTAAAAKAVSGSDRSDIAAICSRRCAELYGLECLKENVQDSDNNYTRFICISRDLEIYPGADRTSIMAITSHTPGALCKLLARFYAFGVNLTKLESRPIPDRSFEFMFYFDIEKSVYSPDFVRMLSEIASLCDKFDYLGSYNEIL
ncbi:MAG: chorismate mutase [Lachnospiraceae bacterium]|nr:chorismate mutase [Lachnospiraceae bacterium]